MLCWLAACCVCGTFHGTPQQDGKRVIFPPSGYSSVSSFSPLLHFLFLHTCHVFWSIIIYASLAEFHSHEINHSGWWFCHYTQRIFWGDTDGHKIAHQPGEELQTEITSKWITTKERCEEQTTPSVSRLTTILGSTDDYKTTWAEIENKWNNKSGQNWVWLLYKNYYFFTVSRWYGFTRHVSHR